MYLGPNNEVPIIKKTHVGTYNKKTHVGTYNKKTHVGTSVLVMKYR